MAACSFFGLLQIEFVLLQTWKLVARMKLKIQLSLNLFHFTDGNVFPEHNLSAPKFRVPSSEVIGMLLNCSFRYGMF